MVSYYCFVFEVDVCEEEAFFCFKSRVVHEVSTQQLFLSWSFGFLHLMIVNVVVEGLPDAFSRQAFTL